MDKHDIEIISDGEPCGTRVLIDGEQIKGVVGVDFGHVVNNMPFVTIGLYPKALKVTGQAEVERVPVCPNCRNHMPKEVDVSTLDSEVALHAIGSEE